MHLGQNSIERAIYPIFKNIILANEKLAEKNIEIKLSYFAGDTPISQAFCGFVEAVGNANFPCRICYIHKDKIVEIFDNSEKFRKFSDSYSLVDSNNKYGVVSIPNFVKFKIIDPVLQSPMDIMHVIPEGCCRKQVMRIFEEWITTKRCTWVDIKSCLDNFIYGYTHSGNKIKNFREYDLKKSEFIVSSSQMLTLILLFPFIFEDIIDISHEEYK